MHNSSMRRDVCDAYQVLLMHNVLSSVVATAASNRNFKDAVEIETGEDAVERDIAYANENSKPLEGKCERRAEYCGAECVTDTAAMMSACTAKQFYQIAVAERRASNDKNEYRTNVGSDYSKKPLLIGAQELSATSSTRLSGKYGISIASRNSKELEQTEAANGRQSIFKLHHIKSRRYVLVSHETQIPAVAFSHLPYNRERLTRSFSQSDDPSRLGVICTDYATIRPINYKRTQELSFRDLLSRTDSTSSEENSPVPNCKFHSGDDKSSDSASPCPLSRPHMVLCERFSGAVEEMPPLLRHSQGSSSSTNSIDYDPNLLSNFDADCWARKTVMKFNGYVSTIMHYQPDNEVKRLVNEAFHSRFPQVYVSFSKINSIKRELHQIAVACNLEDCTTAHAFVFYEKVLLKGLVSKVNRKLVAGAALLVAAKITDFGSMRVTDVVNYLESSLRVNHKELLRYEIPLCAALSFDLKVPDWQLLPHYQRITLSML